MNNNWLDIIIRHKRLIAVIGGIVVAGLIALGVMKYIQSLPVNLDDTDLSDTSQNTKDKAAAQMSIEIKKLPASVDDETKTYLENQLAFILRQKYGAESNSYTATVRQVIGYNEANALRLYVDVPEANETYLGYINVNNHNGTFICASQDQQMDPSSSKCVDMSAGDENNFPNG